MYLLHFAIPQTRRFVGLVVRPVGTMRRSNIFIFNYFYGLMSNTLGLFYLPHCDAYKLLIGPKSARANQCQDTPWYIESFCYEMFTCLYSCAGYINFEYLFAISTLKESILDSISNMYICMCKYIPNLRQQTCSSVLNLF